MINDIKSHLIQSSFIFKDENIQIDELNLTISKKQTKQIYKFENKSELLVFLENYLNRKTNFIVGDVLFYKDDFYITNPYHFFEITEIHNNNYYIKELDQSITQNEKCILTTPNKGTYISNTEIIDVFSPNIAINGFTLEKTNHSTIITKGIQLKFFDLIEI